PLAEKAGLKPEIAQAVADGRRPSGMAADEEIVFDFCSELHANKSVSDATYQRALEKFGEQGIIDLTAVNGYYSFNAMILNVARRTDWGARNTSKDFFHDPFVMFGFLSACTSSIEFSTQVMILPQRQTALVAKQAASLDVLSGGRFRFGIGIGWNPVEYVGLNENFHNRGRRSEEQVQVLRALWAEPHVTFKGQWHTIDDAGINPLPTRRKIPLWFGGHEDVTLRRIAKWGDGWIMLAHPLGAAANAEFEKLRGYAKDAGRDPRSIGLEV